MHTGAFNNFACLTSVSPYVFFSCRALELKRKFDLWPVKTNQTLKRTLLLSWPVFFFFHSILDMRAKFDQGEDPMDPESQQQQGFHRGFHGFNPFGSGPFSFKFGFNWRKLDFGTAGELLSFFSTVLLKKGRDQSVNAEWTERRVATPLTPREDAPMFHQAFLLFLEGKFCCCANTWLLKMQLFNSASQLFWYSWPFPAKCTIKTHSFAWVKFVQCYFYMDGNDLTCK